MIENLNGYVWPSLWWDDESLLQAQEEFLTENLRFRHFPELDHGDTLHLAVYDAFKTIFATP